MKLVENKMSGFDWQVRDYLVNHCVGEENGIVEIDLASELGVNRATTIRKSLKKIKIYSDTRICRIGRLVFVPRDFEELVKGMHASVQKTKSHMQSDIMQNPELHKYYHFLINKYYNQANKAPQGQTVIKFNGWERDVDYYAKRYGDKKEEK